MNALQTHFWAVRDYLAPVLRESKFKEHGRITPEEFVAAGDFLSYKFPTWSWSAGEASKTRDFLPKDKQYIISKGVPCLRRVSQMETAALGSKKKGDKKGQPDERLLSFADGKDGTEGAGGEDDWLATHLDDDQAPEEVGEIADIPDSEPPVGAATLTSGEEDLLASHVAGVSLTGPDGNADDVADADDDEAIGDIPDMDDEDEDALGGMGDGVAEYEDPATAAPAAPVAAPAPTADAKSGTVGSGSANILSVRTYDCLITYDKYYQTPRMWLVGYDEHGVPLKPAQIFEDISSDYAQKTVTIEPFPHSATLSTASVHPCKHASVMKKVIERMDASVKEEQKHQRLRGEAASPDPSAAAGGTGDAEKQKKKKKWGLGGAMKKVTNRSTSGQNAAASDEPSAEDLDLEGLRVDQYLLVFLKFMASIVPAIEIDATQSF